MFALLASLYLDFMQMHPALFEKGNHKKGEIELVLDSKKIEEIEALQKERLLKKGFSSAFSEEASRVGIIAEDTYWIWIRDAVTFPSGALGSYDRLVWRSELDGPVGVAVLPVLPDGKIALNLNYRHATRSWELELPRGARKKGESIEEAADRELKEETGMKVASKKLLGTMAPDTGALSSLVPVFVGFVNATGESDQEESEAIEGIHSFSLSELKQALQKGTIALSLNGSLVDVPVRDSFLTYALFQAIHLGILKK